MFLNLSLPQVLTVLSCTSEVPCFSLAVWDTWTQTSWLQLQFASNAEPSASPILPVPQASDLPRSAQSTPGLLFLITEKFPGLDCYFWEVFKEWRVGLWSYEVVWIELFPCPFSFFFSSFYSFSFSLFLFPFLSPFSFLLSPFSSFPFSFLLFPFFFPFSLFLFPLFIFIFSFPVVFSLL